MFASLRRYGFIFLSMLALALPLSAQGRNAKFGVPKRDPDHPFATPAKEDIPLNKRPQYVVSFNARTNIPNWVSWNLQKSDIGDIDRSDDWQPDENLPAGIDRIDNKFYKAAGFDRGHMCPSKDRSKTQEDNDNTFIFTNCIPQSWKNNQQGWNQMEGYCRTLAQAGNDLHIVCGPVGVRGQNRGAEFVNFLRRGEVKLTVPHSTWKVILVLPNDKAKPDKRTRTISVVMPNDLTVTTDWAKYRCSMEHVEELTNFKFFPEVKPDVRNVLLEKVDAEPIETKKPKKNKKKKDADKNDQSVSVLRFGISEVGNSTSWRSLPAIARGRSNHEIALAGTCA